MSMKMTMAEFVGLEPCPFCGGEAQIGVNKESTVREYFIGCMNCHIRLYKIGYKRFFTEAEAIAAWNTRHVETCENMREKFGYKRLFVCSECGVTFDPDCEINYCPWCGREVVDNAD